MLPVWGEVAVVAAFGLLAAVLYVLLRVLWCQRNCEEAIMAQKRRCAMRKARNAAKDK
jgi:hypothetical protein